MPRHSGMSVRNCAEAAKRACVPGGFFSVGPFYETHATNNLVRAGLSRLGMLRILTGSFGVAQQFSVRYTVCCS